MQLAFVGDIALGDHPKTVGFGFRSRYAAGISLDLASRILPPGSSPDLVFGNMEFPLGFDPAAVGDLASLQCRGLDQYAEFLAAGGLHALNVANNHSAQHGPTAFWHTARVLREAGLSVAGIPGDFQDASVLRVRDRAVAILAWSDRPRQYDSATPPYNEFPEDAPRFVAEARRRADVVVVSIHWGEEFVQVPAERERRIARALIDAGASIVIGHHPHVLREVEAYAGGLIAYSLGNFISDMTWCRYTRLGGCLFVDMDGPNVASHRLALSRIADDYLPTYLSDGDAVETASELVRIRTGQSQRVERIGYAAVVAAEHRRYGRATGLMMARHLHRYPRQVLLPMLVGPIRNRLPFD
jgi:hypothetical protein